MAYTTFQAKLQIAAQAIFSQADANGIEQSLSGGVNKSYKASFEGGAGAGKANVYATKKGALSADTPIEIDMAGGFTDREGNAVTFAKIKALVIANTSDKLDTPTDCVIVVAPASSSGWGTGPFGLAGSQEIKAGYFYAVGGADANGYSVVADTGDKLEIDPGSLDGQYEMIVIGESA